MENAEHEWLSPEFKALFGYTDAEVPNKASWWQEHIFPEDKEKAVDLFYRHVNEGVPYDLIARYRHKDGSTVWVRCRGTASFNEQGVPVRMLGAHTDVTQLMEVQEELRKKEAVLDLLCTTALDGFWNWNMKTGEDFLSSRWKKALGYEEEDIENTVDAWKALLHPEDVPKAFEAVKKHMDEGAPYSIVLRYIRKDGSYSHMLAQGVAQKDEDGEWARMFGTHTDVSYLEEARAARQASEAKTLFLATMSHEIRTPLNAVLGMAEVLQNTQLTEEQQDCVSTLANSGKHVLSLINDILDFSQIEAGLVAITNTDFSIQETVREVVNALQLEAKCKGVAITFDTSISPGAKFLSDPERTRQIVFNLVGNAVKFTQEGTVNVSLAVEELDGMHGVRVAVQDTGCGMAKEHLTRIFEDFTQASREIRKSYGGSGLGLSISKKLVAAMGGTITVESELGIGSTFTAWLPGIIPQSIRHVSREASDNVLLFEQEPSLEQREDIDRGSVARAIRATGRAVVRVSDPGLLEETFKKTSPRTVVCAFKDDGSEIAKLFKLNPYLVLDIGRQLDPDLHKDQKTKLLSLPAFPTTDEMEQALNHQKAKKQDFSRDFALVEIGRDLRILLAEDNKINVKVMRKILSRYPCKVEVACNGVEAIEMARTGGKWDLILMDMIMPELDGVEATFEIRTFDTDTYIVALTANATTQDRESCLESGMNDFMSKPISMDALGRVLAHVATIVIDSEQDLEPPASSPADGKGKSLEAVTRLLNPRMETAGWVPRSA